MVQINQFVSLVDVAREPNPGPLNETLEVQRSNVAGRILGPGYLGDPRGENT